MFFLDHFFLTWRQSPFMHFLSIDKKLFNFLIVILQKSETFLYNSLVDAFVVDLLPFNNLKVRFQLNYVLVSFFNGRRILVRFLAADTDSILSLTSRFPSAAWLEREMWDMFGIFFEGHPDLRRILTDYGFVGYPLRKDFPLVGFEEVRFDSDIKKVISEPIKLIQEYRYFDFLTPWERI